MAAASATEQAQQAYREGNALLRQKRLHDAVAAYDHAISLTPNHAEAHNNRGSALLWLGQLALAQKAYSQAIQLQPLYYKAHNNLGNVLQLQDQPEAALMAYQAAIAAKPNYVEAHHNRGHTLQEMARFADALAAFEHAIALQPDFVPAQHSRALLLLLLGQFEQGFAAFHWREKTQQHRIPPTTPHPRWQPNAAYRRLLLWPEQGVGDEIFFSSFLPDTDAMGWDITVQTDDRLVPLLQRAFPTIAVIPSSTTPAVTTHDCHMPMGELPRLFWQSSLPARRHRRAFLHADQARSTAIRHALQLPEKTLLCGISWKTVAPNTQKRSVALSALLAALNLPSVALLSLQYGDTAEELQNTHVLQCPDVNNTEDLDGLAAAMNACDLIVSIANATVHLAGALGKTTWVLTPPVPDWRWQLQGEQALWYPSVRLFRQTLGGEWDACLQQIRTALMVHIHA